MHSLTIGTTTYQTENPRTIRHDEIKSYMDVLDAVLRRQGTWLRRQSPTRPWMADGRAVPSPVICLEFLNRGPAHLVNLIGMSHDTRGIGIATQLGIPVARTVAEAVRKERIKGIALYLPPSSPFDPLEQAPLTAALIKAGINVERIENLESVSGRSTTWICAPYSAIPHWKRKKVRGAFERSLFGPLEYADDPGSLIGINAVLLGHAQSADKLEKRFNEAYIVHPLKGAESGRIIRCEPFDPANRMKDERCYAARTEVSRILDTPEKWKHFAQRLVPVHKYSVNGRRRRVHERLFFVCVDGTFQLIGGFGFAVADGPVVLSPDAVLQPIHVEA